MIEYEERQKMVTGWRGRRLLACRAADVLTEVARELGKDNGEDPPPDGGLPAVTEAMRLEIENSIVCTLRMMLALNDGRISPRKVSRF